MPKSNWPKLTKSATESSILHESKRNQIIIGSFGGFEPHQQLNCMRVPTCRQHKSVGGNARRWNIDSLGRSTVWYMHIAMSTHSLGPRPPEKVDIDNDVVECDSLQALITHWSRTPNNTWIAQFDDAWPLYVSMKREQSAKQAWQQHGVKCEMQLFFTRVLPTPS